MASHFFCLSTLLTFTLSLHGISAVNYQVSNVATSTPGGIRFNKEIGIPYAKKILGPINKFIWSNTVLQQTTKSDQKPVDSVHVNIVVRDPAVATAYGNIINVSSIYLKEFQGNLKRDFTALMHHEMTHVFQWNGEGTTPVPLIEGIAEYTKLKANYAQPGFAKPGEGDKWDQSYSFTARFLEYCNEITPGFVAKINKKMKKTYNVKYFQELTGKSVDQLWKNYKAKYGH